METEKRPSPESSNNEEIDRMATDHQEEEGSTARRSYECTFCKRGFTNAQALGGHMNIHRKDRVKGKNHHHHHQVPNTASNNKKTQSDANDHHIIPKVFGGEGSQLWSPYAVRCHAQRSITDESKFLQISATNSSSPRPKRNFTESNLPMQSLQSTGKTEHEVSDDSLILRIGPSLSMDCGEPKIGEKMGEVDLELRLGCDP